MEKNIKLLTKGEICFMNIDEVNKRIIEDAKNSDYKDRVIVLGEGKKNAKIFMIGEAPGGDEEKTGRPFVGKAGKNLSEFLEIVGLKREDIYISNVVKIRPFNLSPKTGKPVNRTPNRKELEFFTPYLIEEIEAINPDIIVTLGNTSLRAVLNDKKAVIGDYHGKITEVLDKKLFALYHPASIIYNRSLKDTYYDDLDKLKNVL